MSTTDPSMCDLVAATSFAPVMDRDLLSRRRFLQAAAAGIGVSMLPSWFPEAAGASTGPSGTSGTLVLVVLDGGCDGLHLAPPVSSGAYHDARGDVAIGEDEALPLSGGRGLHPALTSLKARFDAGDVAIIDGVGNARRDLSHFSAMADFQHGGPAAQFSRTGWLGRYLDESGGGDFEAIAIGDRIPLVVHGATRSAITLPWQEALVPDRRSWAAPMDSAMESWNQGPTGLGAMADHVAGAVASMLESADALRPFYTADFTGGPLAGELQLCAKLINAGLGTKVLTVRHGPYDSHTGQDAMLGARMAELDEAIETFFQTLSASAADDVTLLCVSEFGRRVAANGGFGTDHGAGNLMLAVGSRVAGGLHGTLPSLTSLTSDGNLVHEIDYRSVYATILDDILGADHATILGGQFDTVPFLACAPPSPNPDPEPEPEPYVQCAGPPPAWTRTLGGPETGANEAVMSADVTTPAGRLPGFDATEIRRWMSSTKSFARRVRASVPPR